MLELSSTAIHQVLLWAVCSSLLAELALAAPASSATSRRTGPTPLNSSPELHLGIEDQEGGLAAACSFSGMRYEH